MKAYDADIQRARELEPEGKNCGYCGKENDLADDLGWSPDPCPKPEGFVYKRACRECMDSHPGWWPNGER